MDSPDQEHSPELHPGMLFPDHPLTVLGGDVDREYLGLGMNATEFVLADVPTPHLLLIFFNTACTVCIQGLSHFTELYGELDSDPAITFLGIGVLDSRREVARLRHELGVPFPLCADPEGEIFTSTGEESVPVAMVMSRTDTGQWTIRDIRQGLEGMDESLFLEIRELAHGL